MKPVRCVLLGLAGAGGACLSALRSDERYELLAVADDDGEAVRRACGDSDLRGYEDFRQSVMEQRRSGLDAAIVALGLPRSLDFARLAIEQGVRVLLVGPPARTVEEAAALARTAESAHVPIVVARPWQAEPAFAQLAELREWTGPVHQVVAQARVPRPEPLGCQADAGRAGGGALLYGGYSLVDLVVHLLGLPALIWAQANSEAARTGSRSYDSEDALVAAWAYPGRCAVSLAVSRERVVDTVEWSVQLVGREATVRLAHTGLQVWSVGAQADLTVPVHTANPLEAVFNAFATAVQGGGEHFDSTLAEHLGALAAIETSYLAARTGAPESPSRLPVGAALQPLLGS